MKLLCTSEEMVRMAYL